MLINWLRGLFGRRAPIDQERGVSSDALSDLESFAKKLERATARRCLGQEVRYSFTSDGSHSTNTAKLVWAGLPGEPTTVSSGQWAPGFDALYIEAAADRLPLNGKTGYLVYDASINRWYAPVRVAPVE